MRKFEGYQKGVNLGGWLSQADEKTKEHYDTFILREDIEKIASWGCDHVRLPIDYIVIESEDGDMLEDGYAYVDNCFVIRDSKYIYRDETGTLHLTSCAKAH